MAFVFRDRAISKVGVIGSGQIGPDIALHFVKTLHRYGTQVVVVDVVEEALTKGKAKLFKKVDKGGQTGAFKPHESSRKKANEIDLLMADREGKVIYE
jgi:3-hydroxyacyl-CoA dehydrogenase